MMIIIKGEGRKRTIKSDVGGIDIRDGVGEEFVFLFLSVVCIEMSDQVGDEQSENNHDQERDDHHQYVRCLPIRPVIWCGLVNTIQKK